MVKIEIQFLKLFVLIRGCVYKDIQQKDNSKKFFETLSLFSLTDFPEKGLYQNRISHVMLQEV